MKLKTGLATLLSFGMMSAALISGCGGDDEGSSGGTADAGVCAAGTSECVGENAGRACPEDGSEWIPFSCGAGETCSDGACQAACTPGATECAGTSVARVCAEDGSGWLQVACSQGETCQDGACEVGGVCEPGEKVCATDTAFKTCEADGSGYVVTQCENGFVCDGGACVPGGACTPGTRTCVDEGTAASCLADGSGYTTTECPESAPCKDGLCQGTVCVAGESRCAPLVVSTFLSGGEAFGRMMTCVDGTHWEEVSCGTNEVCVYDDLTATQREQWQQDFAAWFEDFQFEVQTSDSEADLDITSPPQLNAPPGSTASCQVSECGTPEELMGFFFEDGGTAVCGDVSDPSVDPTSGFSTCSGIPPANAPQFEFHACTAPETCDPTDTGFCSSECVPGETRCLSGGLQECTEDGTWGVTNSCVKDGVEYQCQNLQVLNGLQNARCVHPVCDEWYDSFEDGGGTLSAETGACTEDGQVIACDANGELMEPADCNVGQCLTVGETVDGYEIGRCGTECTTGEQDCINDTLYRECVDGVWSTTTQSCGVGESCMETADSKVVCGECVPGQAACDDVQIQICGDDAKFADPVDCEMGSCHAGGPNGAECIMECVPGTLGCQDADTQYKCTAKGLWPETGTDCGAGESCQVSGSGFAVGCVECIGPDVPGGSPVFNVADSRCDPEDAASVQSCQSDNTWGDSVTCGEANMCTSDAEGPSTIAWCVPAL